MSWEVRQTRRFVRVYKKLHDKARADVAAAVEAVAADPDLGENKGDLARLWVCKFRSQRQVYLLGYTREDDLCLIHLETAGPHENFCRDPKRGP
jgi:mRNA interferase RelE/StbE